MQVLCFKLSTGEEVIGKCESESTEDYFVSSPMAIQIMQAPGGGLGIGLIPFIHGTRFGEIPISKKHIVSQYEPDKQVADSYLSQVSGISIASANGNSSFLAG